MRIIAGDQKGRRLKNLKGQGIRPTSDMVKGAIFNVLDTKVLSAHVLDLFAGTGNMAFEALSRGAASAVLVDVSPQAVQLMRDNLQLLGQTAQTHIVHADAHRYLSRCSGQIFDLVFLDPPYHRGLLQTVLPELRDKVSPRGVIIAETAKDEDFHQEPFEIRTVKEYGRTKIWFLQNPLHT
ncbi:MAG: 16S rRNA (guanine(966)-N(2))-methyltransferase RsmD [Peptococcaceae bacterium]|nr:16S rRNA (guanine(966)-N(2))-methyltransferase RsmD [Peptococcaceae bacterium]